MLVYDPNDPDGPGGSGTLVNYKGIKGILTATHVLEEIIKTKYVWLPCALRPGTTDIWDCRGVPFVRILTIDNLSSISGNRNGNKSLWPETCLDIAIIQFSDKIFDDIVKNWKKKIVNLSLMREHYYSNECSYWSPDHKHDWIWTFSGYPREGVHQVEDSVSCLPNSGVYLGGGECLIRSNILKDVHEEFIGYDADIIESQKGPTLDHLPKNFSGMSGGGMYQVKLQLINNRFHLEDILLAGVFVAEAKNKKWVLSRGQISLYDVFCSFLDKQMGC